MGTTKNWLGAMERTLSLRAREAERAYEQTQKQLRRLMPGLLERTELNESADELIARVTRGETSLRGRLREPWVWQSYMRMRESVWRWEETAGLTRGARAVLEVVIELAREEGLPWYVGVPAEEVRKLARLSEGRYAKAARELECWAVTREAEVVQVCDKTAFPVWSRYVGRTSQHVNMSKRQPLREALTPTLSQGERGQSRSGGAEVAQWVVRYRRGIPWNRKRAAWWLNYDLLAGTGRALSCFVVTPETLATPYVQRNRSMGRRGGRGVIDDELIGAMSRRMEMAGPFPGVGMRAAGWECEALKAEN